MGGCIVAGNGRSKANSPGGDRRRHDSPTNAGSPQSPQPAMAHVGQLEWRGIAGTLLLEGEVQRWPSSSELESRNSASSNSSLGSVASVPRSPPTLAMPPPPPPPRRSSSQPSSSCPPPAVSAMRSDTAANANAIAAAVVAAPALFVLVAQGDEPPLESLNTAFGTLLRLHSGDITETDVACTSVLASWGRRVVSVAGNNATTTIKFRRDPENQAAADNDDSNGNNTDDEPSEYKLASRLRPPSSPSSSSSSSSSSDEDESGSASNSDSSAEDSRTAAEGTTYSHDGASSGGSSSNICNGKALFSGKWMLGECNVHLVESDGVLGFMLQEREAVRGRLANSYEHALCIRTSRVQSF